MAERGKLQSRGERCRLKPNCGLPQFFSQEHMLEGREGRGLSAPWTLTEVVRPRGLSNMQKSPGRLLHVPGYIMSMGHRKMSKTDPEGG